MNTKKDFDNFSKKKYKYGFASNIESEILRPGLSEETVVFISTKKNEPKWLTEWRLEAYKIWQTMKIPEWANLKIPILDFNNISFYAEAKKKPVLNSLEEADPELIETFNKLGIHLGEQKKLAGVALDLILDSSSVGTTFQKTLNDLGIIFCSFSDGIKNYPELIRKYLGTIVPKSDNYFAALNAAVFSDGSFCYIPPKVKCPMELSTYFRINSANIGQFERTLIIAERESFVSYLEGCTSPIRDENQLHAAVVEIVAHDYAHVNYATVQNWYPGDSAGNGGIYNFVTKRGLCEGRGSKISWTQVETGSAITWKYPSCVLLGDDAIGEFHSIAITKDKQQADTGSKMIHIGNNTSSRIISKGISAGNSKNSYRGMVKIASKAQNAKNFTQCDSLLIGTNCSAHTFPYINVLNNNSANIAHEATSSQIDENQIFYCRQRGICPEDAATLIIKGYCNEILEKLPMEFAMEAKQLLSITLEGSIG